VRAGSLGQACLTWAKTIGLTPRLGGGVMVAETPEDVGHVHVGLDQYIANVSPLALIG